MKKEGYGVLNIDSRAHGKSRPSNSSERLYDSCSKDILSLLKFHKIKKVVIVGYPLGGLIGLHFYKKFPSKVGGMILIDSSSTLSFKTVNRKMAVLAPLAFSINFLAEILRPILGRKEVNFKNLKNASTLKIIFFSSYIISLKDILRYVRQGMAIDLKNIFSRVNVPVLIIEPKKDQIFKPKSFFEMEKMIKYSDLEFINGDHSKPLRDPVLMIKIIKKFLEENAA